MSDFKAKCTKFDFRWGCATDPARGAYSTPLDLLELYLMGATFMGTEREEVGMGM